MMKTKLSFLLTMVVCACLSLIGTYTVLAQQGSWTTKTDMPTARAGLASAVFDGKIYIFGGYDQNFTDLATTEEYDPVTDTWTSKADMNTPKSVDCACEINGKIYVIGSDISFVPIVEEYDPVTDTWTVKGVAPTKRVGFACGEVNGKIYVMGGDTLDGLQIITLSLVEEYDPVTNTWTTKADMPVPRGGFASAVVNGLIYALGGGAAGIGMLATVDVYDPATDTWSTGNANIPTPRDLVSASTVNGIIYVIGGQPPGGGTSLATVEAYDPVNNTWTTLAPMPTHRLDLTTSAVNGRIYAIGGTQVSYPNYTVLSTVEEFDRPTAVETGDTRVPASFVLYQNFPNPFNPGTTIRYELPRRSRVELRILNMLGKEVRTLVNEIQSPGRYEVQWDGRDNRGQQVAGGVYLYRLRAGGIVQTRKMVLFK